ncbi:MAG: hypothetical protein LQ347_005944, partial [Umbilicaria vellea]
VERVGGLRFREGDGPAEEEEVQGVGGVAGGGVFADGVDVFAADGGVVAVREGGAGGAAEDGVWAGGAGVEVLRGGHRGEFGTAGVAEGVEVAVVGG